MKSLDSSQNYPSEDRGMDEVCYPHINRIVVLFLKLLVSPQL